MMILPQARGIKKLKTPRRDADPRADRAKAARLSDRVGTEVATASP